MARTETSPPEVISEIMRKTGMSLSDLSIETRIKEATLRTWHSGKCNPTLKKWEAFNNAIARFIR